MRGPRLLPSGSKRALRWPRLRIARTTFRMRSTSAVSRLLCVAASSAATWEDPGRLFRTDADVRFRVVDGDDTRDARATDARPPESASSAPCLCQADAPRAWKDLEASHRGEGARVVSPRSAGRRRATDLAASRATRPESDVGFASRMARANTRDAERSRDAASEARRAAPISPRRRPSRTRGSLHPDLRRGQVWGRRCQILANGNTAIVWIARRRFFTFRFTSGTPRPRTPGTRRLLPRGRRV